MTQKMDTFAEYPAWSLEVAQCALITAWESLGNYWDDLVVVGALPWIPPSTRRSFERKFTRCGNSRCGFRRFAGSVCRDVWDHSE